MLNVFVAEPNETLRAGIISVISKESAYRVIGEASSRGELMSQLRLASTDVLILEPRMGGATGEGLISQIKGVCPDIAILAFSDMDEIRFGVRLLRAGLKGFLSKSAGRDELINALDRIASGRPHISSVLAEGIALGLSVKDEEKPHTTLSERELDVFCRLVRGERVGAIASTLFLSPKTISTHKQRIFQKMGVSNLSELVRYALVNDIADRCH